MTIASSSIVVDPAQFLRQRRRSDRHRCETDATLLAEGGNDAGRIVRVFDMSLAGIGFHSAQSLPLGSTQRIDVKAPGLRFNSRIRITRCDRQPTGFDIGAEFIED